MSPRLSVDLTRAELDTLLDCLDAMRGGVGDNPGHLRLIERTLAKVQGGIEAPAKAAKAEAEKCMHPVNRRIGDHCAVCGAMLKGAK